MDFCIESIGIHICPFALEKIWNFKNLKRLFVEHIQLHILQREHGKSRIWRRHSKVKYKESFHHLGPTFDTILQTTFTKDLSMHTDIWVRSRGALILSIAHSNDKHFCQNNSFSTGEIQNHTILHKTSFILITKTRFCLSRIAHNQKWQAGFLSWLWRPEKVPFNFF